MSFCDFVVKFDPEKDNQTTIARKIIYSIWVKRLKARKPCVIFIGGDSGEGKSLASLLLQEEVMGLQGLDVIKHIDDINVNIPIEYPKKLDNLLFNQELKKVNIITIHEAREVMKAKLWYSFLNQSISDINAMSRSVKRLMIIVISQFIRDIDPSVRYTLNYYCMVRRPKQKPARLYINVLWKDDRDLEKPKLRKRKLSGYLIHPNGRRQRFVPEYFELRKPRKETVEIFEKRDREAKENIIRKKIDKLVKEMEQDMGKENKKIDTMVDWYIERPDSLTQIGKTYRGKWKLKPDTVKMHDMTDFEAKQFEQKLNDRLKEAGVINEDKDEQ